MTPIGYMLYVDSVFEGTPYDGQALTGSVFTHTDYLEPALAGWQKTHPTARIVEVHELAGPAPAPADAETWYDEHRHETWRRTAPGKWELLP